MDRAAQRVEGAGERAAQRLEQAAARAEQAANRVAQRVERVAESMTTAASAMAGQVEQTANRIVQRAEQLGDQLRQTAERLRGRVESAVDNIRGSAERVVGHVEGVVDSIEGAAGRLGDRVEQMAQRLEDTAEHIVERVTSFADQIEGAADRMGERLGGLIDSLDENAQRLVRSASTMATQLEEFVTGLGQEVSGLVNQVTGAVDRVVGQARELVNTVDQAITRTAENVRGVIDQAAAIPGRVVAEARALIQEAGAALDRTVDELQGVVDAAAQTAQRIVGRIGDLATRCQGAIDQIMAKVDETIDQVKGAATGIVNRVGEGVQNVIGAGRDIINTVRTGYQQTQEAIQNMLSEARRQPLPELRQVLALETPSGGYDLLFRTPVVATEDLMLLQLDGHEGVSQLFEFTVVLETTFDGYLSQDEVDDLFRHTAYLAFGHSAGGIEEHKIHGTIRAVEMLPAANADRVQYRISLVPRMYFTTLTHRSRIFQAKSVPQIVEEVLREYGMTSGEHYELRLNAKHPTREYTVQYQESDYAFISRLLEYEGIFFYFVHTEQGDCVVFSDSNEGFTALDASVPFERRAGSTGGGVINAFSRQQAQVTGKVVLRDYNYRIPAVALSGQAPVDEDGLGYDYQYGEHITDISDARRVARLRAQQHASEKVIHRGQSQVATLRAGVTFALTDHPISSLDGDYAVTEVWHTVRQRGMNQGGDAQENTGYTNRFVCVPRAVPYRPPLRTARAKIHGLTHAKVDGAEPGTPAPIDSQGRYQVVFPWDLVGAPGGGATRWIRMAQPHAGGGWGLHYPLHVGTEVMIAHLDGDPDRPVIVGAVPNPETPSPVDSVLATRGRLLTRSRVLVEYEDDA